MLPSSTQAATFGKYRRDVDGLRAVAVTAIILFHAFPSILPGGFIGVDIFFVISGYLISSILISSFNRGSFSFSDFYARRVRRIFPALAIVLLTCGTAGWFLLQEDEYQQLAKHTLGAAGFIANFMFWGESGYFDTSADSKILLHLWSLGIEEQFYIAYPLLLFFAWKRKFSLPLTILILGSLSFGLNMWTVDRSPAADFFLPHNRAWELMIGALLASIESTWVKTSTSLHSNWIARTLFSVTGLTLLATSLAITTKFLPFPGWLASLPTLGAFCLLAAGPKAIINRALLSNPIVVWIGRISFSLYLWHWPLLTLPLIVTGQPTLPEYRLGLVGATFVLAGLTYGLLENPMRFGRALRLKTATAICAMVTIAVTAAIVYKQGGVPQRALLREVPKEFKRFSPEPLTAYAGCQNRLLLPDVMRGGCFLQYSPETPSKRIIIWGDSHARTWSAPLLKIAQRRRFDLTVISFAGCPPIGGVTRTDIGAKEGLCWSIPDSYKLLDAVISMKPDVLILAARWDLYTHGLTSLNDGSPDPKTHFLTSEAAGEATKESSIAALRKRIPETIQRLQSANIAVIFINTPPLFPPLHMRKPIKEGSGCYLEDHREYNRVPYEILSSIPGITVLDPAEKLCADGTCLVRMNDKRLYIDDNHLTDEGTLLFEEELRKALIQNMGSSE